MKKGSFDLYLDEVGKIERTKGRLTEEEERNLARKVRAGSLEARNELVERNAAFVVFIAKKFSRRAKSLGLETSDLISAGNYGLITATHKFDPERAEKEKVRFISYAVWWIRQSILLYLANERTVRSPINQQDVSRRVNKFDQSFFNEHGRAPTDQEVKENLGLSDDQLTFVKLATSPIVSLDKPLPNSKTQTLYDLFQTEDNPEEELVVNESKELAKARVEHLIKVVNALPVSERNKEIFLTRFGLISGDLKPLTLEETGRLFGVTRERARQIVENIITRVRLLKTERDVDPCPSSVARIDSYIRFASTVLCLPEKILIGPSRTEYSRWGRETVIYILRTRYGVLVGDLASYFGISQNQVLRISSSFSSRSRKRLPPRRQEAINTLLSFRFDLNTRKVV